MQQTLLPKKYPIYIAEIGKNGDKFVISFMKAPMQLANAAMESWTQGLRLV